MHSTSHAPPSTPVPHLSADATVKPEAPPGQPGRSASLERKLPLMISGLLVIVTAAFGFFAFTEVRQSALNAAQLQLSTIVLQTAGGLTTNFRTRESSMTGYAQSALLRRALSRTGTAAQNDSAARFLIDRRTPNDTATFWAQLLVSSGGAHRLVTGASPDAHDFQELDRTISQARSGPHMIVGSPYAKDSTMWYWSATPVSSGDEPLGYIAELRRIRASPANIDQTLKGFTGQDISMYYAAVDGDVWTGLRGVPIKPKFDPSALPDSFRLTTPGGERLMGAKHTIGTTGWFVMFTINEDAVTARSTAFLRRMLVIAGVLLLLGIVAARWVSRRVTEPLKSLTGAARQIADGNYAAREPVRTNDELGVLAQAFNGMATRIGESHALLAERVDESETLARQLHRASQAKSEFLAMMSHELRTPLSAIAGYAEILQLGMRGQLNEMQQADLARIQANQVHLLRIINDILDLAQVESGKMQISTRTVALRDVMDDLEPIIMPLFAETNIRYSVHNSVTSLVVIAERDRLTQVFVNLVANAVRFTESGGSVSIAASRRDDVVQVDVIDTGIGIAAEKLEAIFQPFVQADSGPSRRAQGTGLGLTISRRLVEAMGGTLSVKSTPGKGSTFTLTLQPSQPVEDSAEKGPSSQSAANFFAEAR